MVHVIQIVLLHIISMQDFNLPNGASDRVQLIVSEDGSHTLFVPRLNEHYHSTYGAVNESMHVYIQMGLEKIENTHVRILEVGFGTGLNALLTAMCAKGKTVCYHTFEKYPLEQSVWKALNYDKLAVGFDDLFFQLLGDQVLHVFGRTRINGRYIYLRKDNLGKLFLRHAVVSHDSGQRDNDCGNIDADLIIDGPARGFEFFTCVLHKCGVSE